MVKIIMEEQRPRAADRPNQIMEKGLNITGIVIATTSRREVGISNRELWVIIVIMRNMRISASPASLSLVMLVSIFVIDNFPLDTWGVLVPQMVWLFTNGHALTEHNEA